MSTPKRYVICEDDCMIEGLDKAQIIEAIAEATGNTPTPTGDAFIQNIINQRSNGNLKFWQGTRAQYNAIANPSADTIYIINDHVIPLDALAASTLGGHDASYFAEASKLAGCWISFTDAEGNPTDIPYIHWVTEE